MILAIMPKKQAAPTKVGAALAILASYIPLKKNKNPMTTKTVTTLHLTANFSITNPSLSLPNRYRCAGQYWLKSRFGSRAESCS